GVILACAERSEVALGIGGVQRRDDAARALGYSDTVEALSDFRPMLPITVTLRNYRCFRDERPLTIEIRDQFTALVGPNNSGKSSFLKFFHEARPVLNFLHSNLIRAIAQGEHFNLGCQDITDPHEIFHMGHKRALQFEIEIPDQTVPRPDADRRLTNVVSIS